MMIYCVRCKSKTDTLNATEKMSKNNRPYITGLCAICKGKKSQFMPSKKGGDIHALIGKLPRPKGGFTAPGYKYLGPYNDLDNQLEYNDQGQITKYYVQPKNAVDQIAAQHDVDYSLCGKNTGCKNQADRIFVDKLDNLDNKDKTKWGKIARHVINVKQKLGMGNKYY